MMLCNGTVFYCKSLFLIKRKLTEVLQYMQKSEMKIIFASSSYLFLVNRL